MKIVKKFFLTGLLCLLAVCVFAQTQDSISVKQGETPTADTVTTKKTLVYLLHADTVSYDKEVMKADAQFLEGNVSFRHDSSYMYCDSAYFFEATNSLEAFSNVRMEQGDTLFVYGNYLFYDGDTQIAYLRENVRMENGQVTLYLMIVCVWRIRILHSIRIRFITIPNRRLQQYWDLPSLFQTAGRSILPADGTIRKLTLRCC